jgi:hypothetical protein
MPDPKPKTGQPHVDGDFDREINYRAILGFVVGIILLTALAFGLAWRLDLGLREHMLSQDEPPSPVAEQTPRSIPPRPLLQTRPYQDLIELHAVEDSVLNSYAIVDANAGKVRIPIDEAMRRVAHDGLPQWPAVNPTAAN